MPVTGTAEIGALYAIRMSDANAAILSGLGITVMFTTIVSGEPHFIITEADFSTLQRGPVVIRGGRSDVEGITVAVLGTARAAADDRAEDDEEGGDDEALIDDPAPAGPFAGVVLIDDPAPAGPFAGVVHIDEAGPALTAEQLAGLMGHTATYTIPPFTPPPVPQATEDVNDTATAMNANGVAVDIPEEDRTCWGHNEDYPRAIDHRKAFMRIAARIGASVGKAVHLRCPHGDHVAPEDLGDFTIWLYASPDAGLELNHNWKSFAWGLRTECGDIPRHQRSLGSLIVTPEGTAIATYDSANLFIYHDICHRAKPEEIALFDRIITEAIALIPKEKDMARLTKDEVRARFVTLCAGRIDRQLAEAKSAAVNADQVITEASRRIADAVRSKNDAANLESTLTVRKGTESETLGKEFDNLGRIKKLNRVSFRGDKLVMSLDTMRVTDPRTKKQHEVGKVEVTMDPVRGEVFFKNKTRLVHGMEQHMHAPHVFGTGKPCLGSLSQALPKLVSGYEFAVAIQMIIAFLESVNVDDGAGKHVDRWPLIGEDGKFIPNTYSTELLIPAVVDGTFPELEVGQVWGVREGGYVVRITDDDGGGEALLKSSMQHYSTIRYGLSAVAINGLPVYRYIDHSHVGHDCWDLVKLLSGPGFVAEAAPNTRPYIIGQVWRSTAGSIVKILSITNGIMTAMRYENMESYEQQQYGISTEYTDSGEGVDRRNSPLTTLVIDVGAPPVPTAPAPRRRRAAARNATEGAL